MNNAIASGAFDQFKFVADDLRRTLDGVEGEALNWRPVGDESSSVYMLTTHMMGMAMGMCAIATGKTPQRDRAAEFAAVGTDAAPLLKLLDAAQLPRRIREGGAHAPTTTNWPLRGAQSPS